MIHLHIDKTNIAYFGSFYENIRSPKALLDLMAFIKERDGDFYSRIKFHFIGQQNNYSLNVFNQYPDISPDINCHGFLQRDHAMALIAKMDYLVNFGNTTDYHLPSRVVEYLFFNKPTVNFPAIADDSFSDFVSPYIPLLNINPSKSLEHQYQQFKDFLKEAKPKNSANPKAIQPFLADTIGQAYLDLFQKSSN
ncbi:MAG: hypothetical protein HKN09_13345 [Saprospiraceae bacterium]|nr:hypothetical protein [Saprospiraceae bacterium]